MEASDCILVGGERNSLDTYLKLMNIIVEKIFILDGWWME
jgi:hypothetical protein